VSQRSNVVAGRRRHGLALCAKGVLARTPLVLMSVHAFIWPFSRAARAAVLRVRLVRALNAMDHIEATRSSGFPIRNVDPDGPISRRESSHGSIGDGRTFDAAN
jgi:hypothetical protein